MIQLSGYVKLHRKLLQWGWYSNYIVKDVFLHLLIIAAFKEGEFLGCKIKAGQAVISTQKLADELGFTRQQVRTALKKLESTKEISQKSTNRFTLITIENWADYQVQDFSLTINQPTDNQQITNEQPTDNQQITTSKECKEYKNVKNDNNSSSLQLYVDPFDHDVILANMKEDYQPNLIAMREKRDAGRVKWQRENS